MLTPNKHTDLNLSVYSVSATCIAILRKNAIMKYDELYNAVLEQKGVKAKHVFGQALNFLFILGKLEYLSDLDAIGLTL